MEENIEEFGIDSMDPDFIRLVVIARGDSSRVKEWVDRWMRGPDIPKLRKLGIIGDQLGATIPSSDMSEFGPTAQMSLMQRMIEVGNPYIMMEEQYRMHPGSLASSLF